MARTWALAGKTTGVNGEILRPAMCDHLCDPITRYDSLRKRLTFLIICPTCGNEKAVGTLPYEPPGRYADAAPTDRQSR
jgi:hypothetical protein